MNDRSISTWFPLDIGSYLKNTQALTTEEHGAYLLLIMHYWIQGPIKNDKKTIKNITKISHKKCENIFKFFDEKDGVLYHERIEFEINKAKKIQDDKRNQTEAARLAKEAKRRSVTDSVTDAVTKTVTDTPLPLPLPSLPVTKELTASNQKVLFAGRILIIFEDKFLELKREYDEINLEESLSEADKFFQKQKSTIDLDKRLHGFLRKIQNYELEERRQRRLQENARRDKRTAFARTRDDHIETDAERTFKLSLIRKIGQGAFNKSFRKALIINKEDRILIKLSCKADYDWIEKVHEFEIRQAAGEQNLKVELVFDV